MTEIQEEETSIQQQALCYSIGCIVVGTTLKEATTTTTWHGANNWN